MPAKTNRIAFQGEPGANSDTACRNVYPEMEPLPCPTFEDAFNAVETGKADLAMIPIENTIAGRVADIHHLLPESRLHIVGEYFLPIHFQLMVLPGVRLRGDQDGPQPHPCARPVPQVHPQERLEAGGRRRHGGRRASWSPKSGDRTHGGAGAAPGRRRSTASTSSRRMSRTPKTTSPASSCCRGTSSGSSAPTPDEPMMTTFIFRVRNIPAALYKAMGGFATNGVNMTKLESYQLGGKFIATLFYADIEGHPDDPNVAQALEELHFFSREVRILGVYQRRTSSAPTPGAATTEPRSIRQAERRRSRSPETPRPPAPSGRARRRRGPDGRCSRNRRPGRRTPWRSRSGSRSSG